MTIDELKAALADTELKGQVLEMLRTDGLIVRSVEEEKQFLDNYKQTEVKQAIRSTPEFSEAIGARIKEVHEMYEQDIKNVFGVDRNPSEKGFEYLNRVATDFKKLHESTDEKVKWYETKVAEQEGKIKQAEEAAKALENTLVEKEFDFGFREIFNGAKLRGVDDATKDQEVDFIRQAFLSKYTPKKEGDTIVYYDKNGQPARGIQTFEPLGVKELIDKEFGYKFDTEPMKPTGSGTKPSPTTVNRSAMTREDAYKKASEAGLPMGSGAWTSMVKELTATE